MPVMDEFKEEREALKHGTPKQKLQYFWDYYRWHVIATIIVVVCAGSLIYHFATYKEDAFLAAILNSTELEPAEDYASKFMDYAGLDPAGCKVSFDPSISITFDVSSPTALAEVYYNSREKLNMLMTAGELDVIVSNDELFEHFANAGTFCDLRTYLSQEQLAAYAPYLYYVDKPLMEQISMAERNLDDTFHPEIPDPAKPELMEEPIPVGIHVEDNEELTQSFYIRGEGPVVLGIISNAPHPDVTVKYIEYLMQGIDPAN